MATWYVTIDIVTVTTAGGDEFRNVGHEVTADFFTIEPSGAVTFWKVIIPGEKSELVIALASGQWKKVERQADA